ncbi:TIGR00266 family protein [Agromyces rhizosphaerae]|uniref:TIGR00266 family protein n=1 Tax=Agromyces rhizosphaerae TaxID=88374 RepID=A0A9W6CVB6_9MICO|nr:TIGR00266 family protein [Agromyces rhizosphaerae]GLI26736.1 TIGR00266 family protein [Agromyces rhizosphaerae]
MDVEITAGPAFAMGVVTLPAGGSVRVEAGAMAMTRGDIEIETSTRGGFMAGLKRTFGGESFFVNDFRSGTGGQVGVTATLPGDMAKVTLDGETALMVQSGSWSASDPDIDVDSKWGGGKTFFSGEGLILLRCSGAGDLLMASYGAIVPTELAAGETLTLDTGHVVAFDETVQYSVRKAGSWKSTLLGGEGLVTDFTGPGRVWLQTRSSVDLIGWIKQVNPQRSGSDR